MMPLLPLETWREFIGYHPLHFWQLGNSRLAPIQSGCNDLVRQYAWQAANAVGRVELERAIDDAELALRRWLGYSVGARYTSVEVDVTPTGIVTVPHEGYIQALGQELITALGTPAVTLSDADGDGLLDTFTATLTTALTEDPAGSLAVFVPTADRVARQRRDWQLRPVTVSTALNAGVYDVTVTGPARLLVKPSKYEGITAEPAAVLDANAVANYLDTVLIATRTTDDATVVTGITPELSTLGTPSARILDATNGIIQLGAMWCGAWRPCQYPYWPQAPWRATVHLLAGRPLQGNWDGVNVDWESVVARLAAAEVTGTACGCKDANHWLEYWQKDMARVDPNKEYVLRGDDLKNPFGTRRGHISAWNDIKHLGHARGFAL
jgi:hypothetical protein